MAKASNSNAAKNKRSAKISEESIRKQLRKAKAELNHPMLKPSPPDHIIKAMNESPAGFAALDAKTDTDLYTAYCQTENKVLGQPTSSFNDANDTCIDHHTDTGHNAYPVGSN